MKDRLIQLRKELGYTHSEFAKKIGIAQPTLGGYETGKRIPTDYAINNICKTFNVNEEWLRYGKGELFVTMSIDEEIANFLVKIQMKDDDSYMKRYIIALSKLNEDEWALLEKMHTNTV